MAALKTLTRARVNSTTTIAPELLAVILAVGAHTSRGRSDSATNADNVDGSGSAALLIARLTRAVLDLIHRGADEEELTKEIHAWVGARAVDRADKALVGLLEHVGRAASAALLAAVRGELRYRGLRPSVRLGELLLRGYLCLRLRDEYDDVLAELKAQEGSVPSIAALALSRLW